MSCSKARLPHAPELKRTSYHSAGQPSPPLSSLSPPAPLARPTRPTPAPRIRASTVQHFSASGRGRAPSARGARAAPPGRAGDFCHRRSPRPRRPERWEKGLTMGRAVGETLGRLTLPRGQCNTCCTQQVRRHAQHLWPHHTPHPSRLLDRRARRCSPGVASLSAALGEAVGGRSERVGVVGGDAELDDEGAQLLSTCLPG
jgi:hypothetical protein